MSKPDGMNGSSHEAGRSSHRKALSFNSTNNSSNNIVGKCSSPWLKWGSKQEQGRAPMHPFGLQLGMLQTSPSPPKHSCSGCRDQEQPVDHLFGLSGHLERCCCELGVA